MQKVIGLDIGSYSIKAVEIVNSFKSYEITNFYENVIPMLEDVDQDILIPSCMEQLFKENNLQADRIITAMPGQYISSRIMPLGFSDPRKVEMAILAEIEEAVPFNLDDMIVDHQVLGSMNGKTLAMVVMTRKAFLRSFLEHLQRINIDPKLVDVDSLAFYNLAPFLDVKPGECAGIVDIGHEKTSICLIQDGVLRMFRSINLGGLFISEFLARDMEVPITEAQRVKHQMSRILCESDQASDLSGDDKVAVERMTLACNAIVKELGRTLYAFKTWDKTDVTKMYLSGGTAKIKNLDKYLAEQLNVDVNVMRLDETSMKISPHLKENMMVLPQGVAVGMRAIVSLKRHSQINLRRGEFAYVQNYEQIMKAAGIVFRVVAIALGMLTISYALKYFIFSRQIDQLDALYQKEYAMVAPGKKKPAGNVAFAKLRTDIKSQISKDTELRRTAVEQFLAESGDSPALILLKDLSAAVPKTVKVDITQYNFQGLPDGGGKVVLKGETDAYESFEKLKDAVKQVPFLSGIEEKQVGGKPGTDNKVIEFTINALYKTAAAAPSKKPT